MASIGSVNVHGECISLDVHKKSNGLYWCECRCSQGNVVASILYMVSALTFMRNAVASIGLKITF